MSMADWSHSECLIKFKSQRSREETRYEIWLLKRAILDVAGPQSRPVSNV